MLTWHSVVVRDSDARLRWLDTSVFGCVSPHVEDRAADLPATSGIALALMTGDLVATLALKTVAARRSGASRLACSAPCCRPTG